MFPIVSALVLALVTDPGINYDVHAVPVWAQHVLSQQPTDTGGARPSWAWSPNHRIRSFVPWIRPPLTKTAKGRALRG